MVGSPFGHDTIVRRDPQFGLAPLLEAALGIQIRLGSQRRLSHRPDERLDKGFGGDQPAIKIERPHHGFEGITQVGVSLPPPCLLFPATQPQHLTDSYLPGKPRQRLGAHQGYSQARHPPLVKVGVVVVDPGTSDKVEHRVAQELEALIVANLVLRVFVDVGGMRESAQEKARVAKMIPNALLESVQ